MDKKQTQNPKVTNCDLRIETVEQRIYLLRGVRVMLDRDLAQLYDVQTKKLNQAVTRNLNRFPDDFMFQLNKEETEILRFQSGTLGWGTYSKYSPRAFTEHGVAMLSSGLRSPRAAEVNIAIMRAFVKLRDTRVLYKDLRHKFEELEKKMAGRGADIKKIFRAMRWLTSVPKGPKKIGFRLS
jgi:hypothetical protein